MFNIDGVASACVFLAGLILSIGLAIGWLIWG